MKTEITNLLGIEYPVIQGGMTCSKSPAAPTGEGHVPDNIEAW